MTMPYLIKRGYSLLFGSTRSALLENTSKEIKQILLIILTIILSFALPLIFLGSIPLLYCRRLHEIFIRKLNPHRKSVKILHPTGQTMVSDFFKENPILNIVFCSVVGGRLTTDQLKQCIQTHWLQDNCDYDNSKSKIGQDETLKRNYNNKYPELQQKCVNICGYYYWIPINGFNINDYVQELNYEDVKRMNILSPRKNTDGNEDIDINEDSSECFTQDDLKRIVAHLTSKNWRKDQSPWEFYIIHNYKGDEDNTNNKCQSEEKTLVIFRTHHFFVDGYSLLNLILNLVTGDKHLAAIPNFNSGNALQVFLYKMMIWLKTPFALAQRILTMGVDENEWRVCMRKMNRRCYTSWAKSVPIDDLKLIKKKFGVSFQAVLHTLIGKAIKNLMESAGQSVPEEIKAVVPVPLPNHPEGLENYFTFAVPSIPIKESDVEKRLNLAWKELKKAGRSLAPIISYPIHLYGGQFNDLITRHTIAFNPGNTIAFTSFPGINGPSFFCGRPYLDIFGTIGTSIGNAGASLTAVSCFGNVRFGITIDTGVFPSQEMLFKFDEYITKEVDLLLQKCRSLDLD